MKVWDAVVRLLHWTLAALIVFDWVYDDGGWVHRLVGYAAVCVVLLRLVWAVSGRGQASLVPSPSATLDYLALLRRGRPPRYAGHDPLGLWMVWLLWLLVLALGITGWMSRLDAFWGDDLVNDLHTWLADALAVAVLIHVSAVCVMSVMWRENLSAAMVSGVKRPLK